MGTGLGDPLERAESKHDAALCRLDDVDARGKPDEHEDDGNDADGLAGHAGRPATATAAFARALPAAAAPPTEQLVEALLHLAQHLVEVGRTLIATLTTPRVAVPATRLIPGHRSLR